MRSRQNAMDCSRFVVTMHIGAGACDILFEAGLGRLLPASIQAGISYTFECCQHEIHRSSVD